jgi:hypothetical protein
MSSVSESPSNDARDGVDAALDGTMRIPDHVVYRSFPGETVALNLTTGRYHGLNPVAGRMIETLAETGNVEAAAALLAQEYEQPAARIEADLRGLCADLIERGLIEVHPAGDS